MKLDAKFYAKNKKLYKIDDDSLVDVAKLNKISITWSSVEISDEVYNEEYLANLRDELKRIDLKNEFVILVPKVDKTLETPEQYELFINAFNHTARRIKDCICVVGIELPLEFIKNGFEENSYASDFIETLSQKHSQYVYFVLSENLKQNDENIQKFSVVVY